MFQWPVLEGAASCHRNSRWDKSETAVARTELNIAVFTTVSGLVGQDTGFPSESR